MEQAPQDMPTLEFDEFDTYWHQRVTDNRYEVILIDPAAERPIVAQATAPLGYHNLVTLLESEHVFRIPIRSLYGQSAHVYTLGYTDDNESADLYDAAPVNPTATEILDRHDFKAEIRGRLVIVKGDGLDPRDTQQEMIDADAPTMVEIERDHARDIGPAACREWAMIEAAMRGQMVPSLLTEAPSLDRIAWLIRAVLMGIDTDVIAHAAMNEVCEKKPLLAQCVAALWSVQASYFAGVLPEMSEEELQGPPRTPKPAGFSERYGKVIH